MFFSDTAAMDEAKQLLLQVVQELYEDNKGRIPAAKKVRDATGLSLQESKDLLEECKPLLKKPRQPVPEPAAETGGEAAEPPASAEGAVPGSSRDPAPAKSEAPPAKYEVKAAQSEAASKGDELAAPVEPEQDSQLGETQPGLEVAETQLDTPSRGLQHGQSQRWGLGFLNCVISVLSCPGGLWLPSSMGRSCWVASPSLCSWTVQGVMRRNRVALSFCLLD